MSTMTGTAKQPSELDMHKQALGYLFARQPQTNGEIAEVMAEFAKDRLQEREKETAALREEVERLRSELADALEELDVESNYSSCNYNSERAQRISALREGQKGSE